MVYCSQAGSESGYNKYNKIIINNSPQSPLNVGHNDRYIIESVNTKFFGLQIARQ
jgi:hypothetical protein